MPGLEQGADTVPVGGRVPWWVRIDHFFMSIRGHMATFPAQWSPTGGSGVESVLGTPSFTSHLPRGGRGVLWCGKEIFV